MQWPRTLTTLDSIMEAVLFSYPPPTPIPSGAWPEPPDAHGDSRPAGRARAGQALVRTAQRLLGEDWTSEGRAVGAGGADSL